MICSLRYLAILLLLASAGVCATTNINCTGTDTTAIQTAATAGGTITINGSCGINTAINVGSNTIFQGSNPNGNISGNGATTTDSLNWTGATANSTTTYMFSSNGNNNTLNGLTISGAFLHMNGGSGDSTTCQNGWTITNNTIQNITTGTTAITVDNCIGRGNRTVISHNYFHNIWQGGYKANDSGRNTGCCFGVFINTGIDNLEFDWNYCNQVAGNCFKAFQQGFVTTAHRYLAHNFDMSYNLMDEVARIGFEIQVNNNGNCQNGSVDCIGVPGDGFTLLGNWSRKQYYPIQNFFNLSNLQSWSGSVIANNQAVINLSGPCNKRPGIAFEISLQGGVFQGNVAGAPSMDSPCTTDGGTRPVGYQTMLATGYTKAGPVNTFQNDVYCQPNTGYKGSDGDDSATYIFQGEYFNTTCPAGTLSGASNFALSYTTLNNQTFPSGGSGTWRIQIQSPLAIRWVDWAIDGVVNPSLRQILGDYNSAFTTTRQWLYHATFNTSTLTNGTHTIAAVATDVSATSSPLTNTQSFTVGGSSTPVITLSPTSLTYTANGSQTVTVKNTGSAPLTVSGISISGTGAAAYSQTNTCPGTLAVNATCTASVTFSPATGGSYSATLNIANNSTTNPATVSLTGTVVTLIFSQSIVPSGGSVYTPNTMYQPGTITINAWVELSSTSSCSGKTFASYGQGSTSPFQNYTFQMDGSCRPQFYWQTGTGQTNIFSASTALAIQTGGCTSAANCTMVTATYNGSAVTIYINGNSVGNISAGGTPIFYQSGLTSGLGIGRQYDFTSTFPGVLSTVSMYSGAASPAFVQFLYSQGPTPATATISCSPSNCVAQAGGTVVLTASSALPWSILTGGVGHLSTAGPSLSTTYTAPSVIDEAHNSLGGCMVLPNDSIFNSRVDTLNVNTNNTNWIAAITSPTVGLTYSWDSNIINTSVPPLSAAQFYYSFANNASFQIPVTNTRLRENGARTNNFSNADHHMVSVNGQNCQFYETYQDRLIAGAQTGACTPGTTATGCTAQSGYSYNSYSYAMPILGSANGGTSDAAGLPLEPLTLRAAEIKSGVINHALRFTTASGFIYPGTFLWPATNENGSAGATAPPLGARVRMKSTFSCAALSTNAQTVCTALKQYGMILADISGAGNQITVGNDVFADPSTRGLFNELSAIPWNSSTWEWVDESVLQLSSTLTVVTPTSGFLTPSNSAIVAGGTTDVPIILDPITIGTDIPYLTVLAGSSYMPNVYINGTGTSSVNWTITGCSAGTSNCGSITAGVYTAPDPSVVPAGTKLSANLVATSVADPAVSTTIVLTVLPIQCKSADSIIRVCIDTGASTSYGPDANGDTWSPDVNPTVSYYNPINTANGWGSVVDGTLFKTLLAPVGDITYNIALPNGNYMITLFDGVGYDGGGGPLCNAVPSSYDTTNRLGFLLEGNGVIGAYNWIPGINTKYMCFGTTSTVFPATVTNGFLNINFGAFGDDTYGRAFNPYVTNFKIESDTSGPRLSIYTSQVTGVFAGSNMLQLYAIPWYYTPGTLVWSIISGPGSIDSVTGIYTSPSSLTISVPVVIQVTDGVQTATASIPITGTQFTVF